ncbi:MAG: Hsp20 family protein, partial [Bdellovibrionales bacterium]|nr:Hsp20 family protein [Bdellovibrionales bacterium]
SGWGQAFASNYQINTIDDEDSVVFEIQFKGKVDDGTLNVNVENGMVTISGRQVQKSQDNEEGSWVHFSSSSSFSQSFSVPYGVDENNVQIKNQGNKVILTFPKKAQEV